MNFESSNGRHNVFILVHYILYNTTIDLNYRKQLALFLLNLQSFRLVFNTMNTRILLKYW